MQFTEYVTHIIAYGAFTQKQLPGDLAVRQAVSDERQNAEFLRGQPDATADGKTNLQLHRILVSSGKGGRGIVLTANPRRQPE